MACLYLSSWNVNGVRSIAKKGFFDWLAAQKPFLVALQETKISAEQLTPELSEIPGYVSYWSHAEKKGYSGVAIYCRQRPLSVREGLGIAKFDNEGRVLTADFGDFHLLTIYFPNGKANEQRLKYKLEFYEAFLTYVTGLKKHGKKLVICGDFNTAHKAIDLSRPGENESISGFLPCERELLDRLIKNGYLDTFREFNQQAGHYTWWHTVTKARERNVGWRIDYFFTCETLKKNLKAAGIQSKVAGSDHCPVTIELAI